GPRYLALYAGNGNTEARVDYVRFVGEEVTGCDEAADGLVLHYKLDEASGNVAHDSSPTGRDATVEGGAAWEGGEGLGFTGSNHVRMPNDVLAGVEEITVAFDVWIDPTLTPNYFFFNFG